MFIYYLVHELFEFMAVYELALVHEFYESLLSNYRPVGLSWTCVCCKWLEHILWWSIYFNISKSQIPTWIYRSGHSCKTQLILTTHDLQLMMWVKALTSECCIFPKCLIRTLFDTSWRNLTIRGNIHLWIRNFLVNHTLLSVLSVRDSPLNSSK